MEDYKKEINNLLHQNQSQFVYLLLAIDISAIGFAINRTIDIQPNWKELLLGLALLCWGISFLCGCSFIEIKSKVFIGNLKMFDQPHKRRYSKEGLDKISERGVGKYKRLKYYLYSGIILFLIWHLIKIIKL